MNSLYCEGRGWLDSDAYGGGAGQPIACFSLSVDLANMEHSGPNVLAKWDPGGTGGSPSWISERLAQCRAQKVQPMVAAVVILMATQAGERT